MWIRVQSVHGVFISVFLCMRSVLSTGNEEGESSTIPDVGSSRNQAEDNSLIRQLHLHHAADYYYNHVLTSSSPHRQAAEYTKRYLKKNSKAKKFLENIVQKNYIKKQYIYIASTWENDYVNTYKRDSIMLNFYLTIQAYEVAVYFRICAFFYSSVTEDQKKRLDCSIISSYMEWYFSFLLNQKAIGLCDIKEQFDGIDSTKKLRGSKIYNIFGQLSLNFLNLPHQSNNFVILKNDWNLYKPEVLMKYKERGNYEMFESVLQQYQMPTRFEEQSQDDYNEMVFNQIWSLIMKTYTEKFSDLMCYMFRVTSEICHERKACYSTHDYYFMKNFIWDNSKKFIKIMKIPSNKARGVYISTNEDETYTFVGDKIFRSNAVEILREILYIQIDYFTRESGGINEKELKTMVSSGEPKYYLRKAPESVRVDYSFALKDN